MKKTNKLLVMILSLVMVMSSMVIVNAENTTPQTIPAAGNALDLNAETVGGTPENLEGNTYVKEYKYVSQVDCSLNFQVNKDAISSDYEIYFAEGNGQYTQVTPEKAAAYPIKAKTTYYIKIVRKYNTAVANPYIGYIAKLNPVPLTLGSITASGDNNIDTYYTFTPTTDGGYLFNLEPSDGCIGANKNYQVNVYSKVGSSVNEFASFEKGKSKSMLRLYLKAGTEYIVEAIGYGAGELGYTFTVESIPVGPGVALVGAPALTLGGQTDCTLYPFANRRAFAWYSFTAPKDGCYEFVINNAYDSTVTGDIVAELRDESFSPTEDEDVLYLYENESDIITCNMHEGEICYLQIAEQYRGSVADVYNVGVTAREHTHSKEIIADGNYVSYGCPCQLEQYTEYAFWLEDVKAANAAYTGKEVTPKAKFTMNVVVPDDGSITPTIPESAYTVTVTSKNKKDIGSAKAKIKFVGAYKSLGSYTVSFKIVPKGTTLSSVSATNGGFKAKWSKQTTKTSGYELRYSTNESMSGAKTATIKSNKTTSKNVSKLKSGTKYFVQVRTYKKLGGKKYYSSWSTKKEVTTK